MKKAKFTKFPDFGVEKMLTTICCLWNASCNTSARLKKFRWPSNDR